MTSSTSAIRIVCFDFVTGEKVGEYESISQASRKLYIKSHTTIWSYLYGGNKHTTFSKKRRGVKDRFGRAYHFEILK